MLEPYYQNDLVTLYHGDCLAVMDELRPELEGRVGMLLTDPPYGIGCCKWDVPVDWPAFFAATGPLCRRNAAKVLFCNIPSAVAMCSANRREYRYDLVWDTVNPSGFFNCNRIPMRGHQNVLVFYRALPVYHPQRHVALTHSPDKTPRAVVSENYNNAPARNSNPWHDDGTRYPSSIFSFLCVKGAWAHNIGHLHPTQKPVRALEYLVATYTDPGDLVLDPFAGSGTTGAAALRLGRRCILVEKEEKYCEVAARLLSQSLSTHLKSSTK